MRPTLVVIGRVPVLLTARLLVVVAALVTVALGFTRLGLPSPYLLAAFVVGIVFALVSRVSLTVPPFTAGAAQGIVGVTAGSYLPRSTVSSVWTHAAPILGVSLLTVVLSVAAGLVLARLARVDRTTAAFGMIAGGAAGIISLSRALGADERLVAVMQYLRVLIIVAVTPVIAIGVFGMARTHHAAASGPVWSVRGVLYVACTLGVGLSLARAARLSGGTILGPMLVAAAASLAYRPLVAPIPVLLADLGFAVIGLDVGLRFTPRVLREAGWMLPPCLAVITAMLLVSAGFGAGLAALTHVSMLDGYLATTPGGLTAIIALAVGGSANTTFIVSVQVLRTFLMLAAAPTIASWLARSGTAAPGRASTADDRACE